MRKRCVHFFFFGYFFFFYSYTMASIFSCKQTLINVQCLPIWVESCTILSWCFASQHWIWPPPLPPTLMVNSHPLCHSKLEGLSLSISHRYLKRMFTAFFFIALFWNSFPQMHHLSLTPTTADLSPTGVVLWCKVYITMFLFYTIL